MFTLVEVVGVRIEMPSNQPIVLLKEMEGRTFLPIWVGSVEATAIAFDPVASMLPDAVLVMVELGERPP